MPFSSALSTNPDSESAFQEAHGAAQRDLPSRPDLALLFFSAHHAGWVQNRGSTLQDRLRAKTLLGCCGESVVGAGLEVEQGPAMSLWFASWANPVWMEPFHLVEGPGPNGPGFQGMPQSVALRYPHLALLLLLGAPASFRADLFLHLVNTTCPGLRVVGGQASGGLAPGKSLLLLGDKVLDHGAVGLLLSGGYSASAVVSPGCKPVGRVLKVTQARENRVLQLEGKPALAQLQALWPALAPRDRSFLERELLLGQIVNAESGFLVRPVLGLDQASGALTLDCRLQPGQSVQLLVRDPEAVGETFRHLLRQELSLPGPKPGGALLFGCTRRGSRLFGQANHDVGVLRAEAGNLPVAGFLALGEFGSLGGQNFLQAHTASVVLFGEPTPA